MKQHEHRDGAYDNYWIQCRTCSARRAPGSEWEETEPTRKTSEPKTDPPATVRFAAGIVVCGVAGVIVAACIWLIAVILKAVTLL